jgi:hypothetical protein
MISLSVFKNKINKSKGLSKLKLFIILRVCIIGSNVVPDKNIGAWRNEVEHNIDGTALVKANGRMEGRRSVVVPNGPQNVAILVCFHNLMNYF